jgi:hypothetical protein
MDAAQDQPQDPADSGVPEDANPSAAQDATVPPADPSSDPAAQDADASPQAELRLWGPLGPPTRPRVRRGRPNPLLAQWGH